MRRVALVILLAVAAPVHAQSRAAVDSLVARVTLAWGPAPHGGWCVEWNVVRGDSSALSASTAEFSGSDRSGIYTITMRRQRFAAPVLVGRLRIGHERSEAVAARALARGALLSDSDVLLQHTLVWGAPEIATPVTLDRIIGSETRRTLRIGETIRAVDVASPPVVFAGDTVTAEVIRDGVRLALVGTALQNASLGARVAIRLNRGRRFAGIATGRNTVRLD